MVIVVVPVSIKDWKYSYCTWSMLRSLCIRPWMSVRCCSLLFIIVRSLFIPFTAVCCCKSLFTVHKDRIKLRVAYDLCCRSVMRIDKSLLSADKSVLSVDKSVLSVDKSVLIVDKSLLGVDKSLLGVDKSVLSVDKSVLSVHYYSLLIISRYRCIQSLLHQHVHCALKKIDTP